MIRKKSTGYYILAPYLSNKTVAGIVLLTNLGSFLTIFVSTVLLLVKHFNILGLLYYFFECIFISFYLADFFLNHATTNKDLPSLVLLDICILSYFYYTTWFCYFIQLFFVMMKIVPQTPTMLRHIFFLAPQSNQKRKQNKMMKRNKCKMNQKRNRLIKKEMLKSSLVFYFI